MVCLGSLELERRSFIHCCSVVLAASHYSEGSAGLKHQSVHCAYSGCLTFMSTVLMGLVWPVMSPLLVPVSARNTCPNFSLPSPTTTILTMRSCVVDYIMITTFDCHWTRPGP